MHRIDVIQALRRRLPGAGSLAAAAAVVGDPAPLLDLRRHADATTAGATDAAKRFDTRGSREP